MNKTAIKNFAVWARRKLISDITYKAGMLGITDSGIAEPLPISTKDLQFFDIGTKDYAEVSGNEISQRKALVDAIKRKEKSSKTYKEAFEYIVEEVAYTWFNRLIAIRFMEVNDYLPSGIRVLSSENSAKNEPDFVTTPFDTDLEFTPFEQDKVIQLKDENKLDELFRMLFIKECNKLHEILPELFEKTDDYTELLLTISFTDKDGVVYHLVHDIEEKDFDIETVDENGKVNGQVEILGWMYQYYISEKHDQIINIYKGTVKKDDIPAATQLFTTDWVVRYMVDNSLGRYWIERNPESKLADKLEFFVTPKNGQINYINEKVEPTELTFFDPCMGSGHILVYAFDVLMEIYRECGYSDRDAALNIVQFNLHGLDIDKRAYQLAYFAVMMKARSYNRRALTSGVWNNVAAIEESNDLDAFKCDGVTTDKEQNQIGEYLLDAYRHAKEIGSLQTIEAYDYKAFAEYLLNLKSPETQLDLFTSIWFETMVPAMLKLTKQAAVMSKKYAVVCTNPPYMGKLDGHLKDFVVNNYKEYSGDLFSVFMYRNFAFCKKDGYSAFMTPNVWMHLKSYENLRKKIIIEKNISTFLHIAKGSFYSEATVDVCAFVIKNKNTREASTFYKLDSFPNDMDSQRDAFLKHITYNNDKIRYDIDVSKLLRIVGSPLSYWVTESIVSAFEVAPALGDVANPCQGLATTNNDLFLRLWHEVDIAKVNFNCNNEEETFDRFKWFPINKGGEYRKWYGNNEYLINFKDKGKELCDYIDKHSAVNHTGRVINRDKYFKPNGTWSAITSGSLSVRYSPKGFIISNAGMAVYSESKLKSIVAFLNSKITTKILIKVINESLNFNAGDIVKLPYILQNNEKINELSDKCIRLSAMDWDSFETSWDFTKHPLVRCASFSMKEMAEDRERHITDMNYIEEAFVNWSNECYLRFTQLKENEEELNRIFIDIYGLQDELTPEVEEKDVTVRKADLQREIKSLISYAVGCMLGRYSLDAPGLAYAGGDFGKVYRRYVDHMVATENAKSFGMADEDYEDIMVDGEWKKLSYFPDVDNCIPITDEEYFEDDIVGRFVKFIETVYGKDTLEDNLEFIAKALGNKGNTNREVIRNYFLNDFIKDHIKIYQKRPIYWLFDSGKQNGFKAICYMHRWHEDTIGNMRVEYLHRMQWAYEKELERMQEIIDNSRDNKEISAATKRKEKLQKQLKETKEYDAKVAHLALSRIGIDLDDGVKVNYEKVQTASDGTKLDILAKI